MGSLDRGLMLHVGLPKTGTTTIQRVLFACHPQIYYLGKIVKNNKTKRKCLDVATYQVLKNVLWDFSKPLEPDHIKALFRETMLPAIPEDRSLVGSWEDLGYRATAKHVEMLRRVKAVFGDFRIMFTLRNPLSLIPSLYIQDLRGRFVNRKKILAGSEYLCRYRRLV